MIGRPESMARTGANGEFELMLSGGGKYYIRARSRHGGPRQPGEWAGKLAGVSERAGCACRPAGDGFDDSHGADVVKRARGAYISAAPGEQTRRRIGGGFR